MTPSDLNDPVRTREVLLFSYHFPPIGGAGTQRPAKFARYLPESGWRVHVLTSPGTAEGRWTPHDSTLEAEVPSGTRVTRVLGEPSEGSSWNAWASRWFHVTTPWERWWSTAAVAAGQAAKNAKAIWTIMPPYVSANPSIALARSLDVPWIADLGDPWALDEMMIYATRFHRALMRSEMQRALRTAAAIVMSTPEAVARVRASFPELSDRPIVAIPNGFDASDFTAPTLRRADNRFRIVHTGYLHTELGHGQRRKAALRRIVGGHVTGVDVLTRSHVYLLQAVERLLIDEPSLADRLELVFAGVLSDTDRAVAEQLSVTRLPGYLPHAKSVALIRSADLLFLPMQNLPNGMRSAIVPGKTYEYLASGRPILAAVPQGDARDLMLAAGTGLVCEPDDVGAMARIIRRQVDCSQPPGASSDVGAYEYRHLARRVAELLDDVAGSRNR